MKYDFKSMMASLSAIAILSGASLANAQTFDIVGVDDFGEGDSRFPAVNAVDGETRFASRWAGNFEVGDGDANLFVDLGSVQRVDNVGVAWGRGNRRTYDFEIRARSGTSGSWTVIRSRGDSSGTTNGIENYNVTDFNARQVRIRTFSNSDGTNFVNVTEFEVYGTQGRTGGNLSLIHI